MKKLTLLFTIALLVVTATAIRAQILTKDQMIADWQRAKAYTKSYLDAMPEDGYSFKPTHEMRTFAAQFLHLADGNYFFAASASGKPSTFGQKSVEKTVPQTKEATTKAVMDSYDFVISCIQGMTDAQFAQTGESEGHKVTKGIILLKAFEHQTHHRGQTVAYLRLKGVTPPPEVLF
ncbi:MAG: DinB family protein [Bacteroidetes bacterium]|nr:DinB family protein [Bacteroidota bacterium]